MLSYMNRTLKDNILSEGLGTGGMISRQLLLYNSYRMFGCLTSALKNIEVFCRNDAHKIGDVIVA